MDVGGCSLECLLIRRPESAHLLREFLDEPHHIVQRPPQTLHEEDKGGGLHVSEVGGSRLGQVALCDVEACELWSVQARPCRVGRVVMRLQRFSKGFRRLTVGAVTCTGQVNSLERVNDFRQGNAPHGDPVGAGMRGEVPNPLP